MSSTGRPSTATTAPQAEVPRGGDVIVAVADRPPDVGVTPAGPSRP